MNDSPNELMTKVFVEQPHLLISTTQHILWYTKSENKLIAAYQVIILKESKSFFAMHYITKIMSVI